MLTDKTITDWVTAAPNNETRMLREAVHTILTGISQEKVLSSQMVMKGGMLMAICYNSPRFTKDIDFSIDRLQPVLSVEAIQQKLDRVFALAVEQLDYDLDCRIQTMRAFPRMADSAFSAIKMTVGYAYRGTPNHKRLQRKQCTQVVQIDYSINELLPNVENLQIEPGVTILVYSLEDLMAEKIRSLLQQVSRNRNRRQDVFDLHFLLNQYEQQLSLDHKQVILESLIQKSHARGIFPTAASFNDPALYKHARYDYTTLADEIPDALPDFDQIFAQIKQFYESLPFDQL